MKIVIPFNPFYSILCFSLFNISFGLSENNELYDKLQPPTNNKEGEIITEVEIDSNNIEVVENRSSPGVKPLMQEQFLNPNPQPYINTYQRQHVSTEGKNLHHWIAYFQTPIQPTYTSQYQNRPLDIIGYQGTNTGTRPTIDSLSDYAAKQGQAVTTPEDLLEMCCQYPAVIIYL